MLLKDQIKDFVIRWNNKFPLDSWYRRKYGIAFNSQKHREVSFLDMLVEYEEEQLFKRLLEERDSESNEDGVEVVKMTKKELDKEFDDLDISQFNK